MVAMASCSDSWILAIKHIIKSQMKAMILHNFDNKACLLKVNNEHDNLI